MFMVSFLRKPYLGLSSRKVLLGNSNRRSCVLKNFLIALISVIIFVPTFAAHPQEVRGEHGAVASRSAIASDVGVAIMKQGGNAIDAAVATGFALAVTYPSAGNLGGGGFMVIHLADGKVVTLDFREVAPAAAHRDMYLDEQGNVIKGASSRTARAIGVPGSVDGLLEALEKYGTMTRQQILAPAIALAKDGFELNHDLAGQFKGQMRFFKDHQATKELFSNGDEAYQAGDTWKQPDLATTLQLISDKGRDGFYKGKTADLLVAEMSRIDGLITAADLAGYKSKWREPVRGEYRGHTIWSMPPPSSGGVLLIQMLNMLEPYSINEFGWGSAKTVHLMIEAQRRAYADRALWLGDPDFFDVPVAKLISKNYASQRFSDVDPQKAGNSSAIDAGQWPEESMETTHYSTVDAAGNAVACTTTLNWGYGLKKIVTGAGFLLNNEMDDFSAKANVQNSYKLLGGKANEVQPGKRMLSSMTPTIVTRDGKVLLVTGSPGGSTIINTVFHVVLNVIDHQMSLSDAVGNPRFHHQWMPDLVRFEQFGLSPDTISLLKLKGHENLQEMTWRMGDANSIMVKDKMIFAMSDPRNVGGASAW